MTYQRRPPQSYEDEPKFSRKEAAQRLGVSEITLFRWTKARRIGFYRLGARVVYGAHHLRAFLDAAEQQSRDSLERAE